MELLASRTTPSYLLAMPQPTAVQPLALVTPVETFRSAIAVVAAMARDITAVTSTTGPLVPASRLDRWMDSRLVGQHLMPMAIVDGAMASAVGLMGVLHEGAWTNPIPAAVYYALGALGFVAFWAGIYARSADVRIAKHKARIASRKFGSSDLDAMAGSFRSAPEGTKALVGGAFEILMRPVVPHLDAEAGSRRHWLVEGMVSAELSPRNRRIVEAAEIAAHLHMGPATGAVLYRLERLLDGAEPDERSVIIGALRETLAIGAKGSKRTDTEDLEERLSRTSGA